VLCFYYRKRFILSSAILMSSWTSLLTDMRYIIDSWTASPSSSSRQLINTTAIFRVLRPRLNIFTIKMRAVLTITMYWLPIWIVHQFAATTKISNSIHSLVTIPQEYWKSHQRVQYYLNHYSPTKTSKNRLILKSKRLKNILVRSSILSVTVSWDWRLLFTTWMTIAMW